MKKHTKALINVIVLVVILSVGAGLLLNNQTQSVAKNSETVLFTVEQGQSLNGVLDQLEDAGILKSAFFTKIKLKLSGKTVTVHEGQFMFDKSWTSDEILKFIDNPDYQFDKTGSARVTLIEGIWAKEIAKEISAVTNTTESRFLELWNDPKFVTELMEEFEVIPHSVLENHDAKVLLEGFLYPDTYEFTVNESEESITRQLVSNANNKYLRYKDQLASFKLTPYQVITLASIVEYEAATEEDMKMVAGVFMNRLNDAMRLESSVTVCYALYEFDNWEDCESITNNQIDSPYNTYRNNGLTPGPILNPSVAAIDAVLNYTPHNFRFFVANVYASKDDPNYGKVFYSETYEEHEKKVNELFN